MYKKDLFWEIGQKSGCSQRIVRAVMEGMIETMKENLLQGEEIRFGGLFTIKVVDVAERVSKSGFDNKEYYIPSHKKLRFFVHKSFRDMLAKNIADNGED